MRRIKCKINLRFLKVCEASSDAELSCFHLLLHTAGQLANKKTNKTKQKKQACCDLPLFITDTFSSLEAFLFTRRYNLRYIT